MKTTKLSLSALSASVLACSSILQVQQAHAVPNPVSFIEETENNPDATLTQAAVLTTKIEVHPDHLAPSDEAVSETVATVSRPPDSA